MRKEFVAIVFAITFLCIFALLTHFRGNNSEVEMESTPQSVVGSNVLLETTGDQLRGPKIAPNAIQNTVNKTETDLIELSPEEVALSRCYLEQYKDLAIAFAGDLKAAKIHYEKVGKAEGRKYECPQGNTTLTSA